MQRPLKLYRVRCDNRACGREVTIDYQDERARPKGWWVLSGSTWPNVEEDANAMFGKYDFCSEACAESVRNLVIFPRPNSRYAPEVTPDLILPVEVET